MEGQIVFASTSSGRSLTRVKGIAPADKTAATLHGQWFNDQILNWD
jgi:hypothetical protein